MIETILVILMFVAIAELIGDRRRLRSVRRQLADATANLEAAREHRAKVVSDAATAIGALRRQVDHLERMRKTGLWIAEQETALRELKTVLKNNQGADPC